MSAESIRGPLPAVAFVTALAVVVVFAGCEGTNESAEEAFRQSAEALRARDYPAVVEAATRATQIDRDHTGALLNLGMAQSAQKNWTEAIAAYERVIELDPTHKRALNNLANVYFRQGRYAEAGEWYRKALEIDPDYLLAAFHYGWVLRQLNELEESERVFTHCKELSADNDRERRTHLDCHFYLGTIRFRQGDYRTAARVMEEVLTVYPGHPEARHFLGLSYRKMGRMEDAAKQLEIHREILRAMRSKPIPEPVDQ
jgi:tetratricopeptide (TPR) repeat protein